MKSSLLRELLLYRFRYVIGYGLFVLFLCALLLTDIQKVPYGVSEIEMQSSVASNALNPLAPKASDVINLPYHLLQKLSIGLFGLTPLSIRLPSLLLGVIAAIIMAATLNQWFRKGIAMLALLLTTASVPFMIMARTGAANILYMVLLLIILLAAVKLTTKGPKTFLYKLVVTATGILLFYMPLGIYAVLALLIAGIFHPHVRYQIKRTAWWQFAVLGFLALTLLAPLIFAAFTDNATLEVLLGIDALKSKLALTSIVASLGSIVEMLFIFSNPQVGEILLPLLSLPFLLFVLFGLVRTVIDRHAARSYLLLIWLGISFPLLIMNPSQFALLFVPSIILVAIGIELFMREWYRLFPRNPYARIGALVPLSLIVIGMVATSADRYFNGYNYTDTSATHHPELLVLHDTIKPQVSTQLVVPNEHVSFYDILRSKNPKLSVVSPDSASASSGETIVLASASDTSRGTPSRIVTSHMKDRGVLLRVYEEQR